VEEKSVEKVAEVATTPVDSNVTPYVAPSAHRLTDYTGRSFDERPLRTRPAIIYDRDKILSDVLAALVQEDPLGATVTNAVRHVILGTPGIGKSTLAPAALHSPAPSPGNEVEKN